MSLDNRIKNLARLVVEFGANVKPGEDVVLMTPVENPEFARMIVEACYEAGARHVSVDWSDDVLKRMRYQYEDQETLNEVPDYEVARQEYRLANKKSNRIVVISEDPDALEGLDEKKIAESIRERSKVMKPFRKYTMNDIVSWSLISIPTVKWAMKVFPGMIAGEAINKLWEAILDTSRVTDDWEETRTNWKNHLTVLAKHADFLNANNFDKVHYTSSNGTNLVVELPKGHMWKAAISDNEKGDAFVPNMPTEEVFTSPLKTGVNGRLVATKPLVYNGTVINNFEFRFEDGKVVDFKAEEGEDTLREMLESDEGARYLGEIALVPFDSPINESGILFFNTLFDENASCHFALGKAYPTTVEGGDLLEDSELHTIGLNDSLIHEDFMVGAADLDIIGYKDGKPVQIFKNGNFAY